METKTQHGYLVLADISGFTSYVAGTELEHANEILTELLELIIAHFTPTLTLSKLEGDAVYVSNMEDFHSKDPCFLKSVKTESFTCNVRSAEGFNVEFTSLKAPKGHGFGAPKGGGSGASPNISFPVRSRNGAQDESAGFSVPMNTKLTSFLTESETLNPETIKKTFGRIGPYYDPGEFARD